MTERWLPVVGYEGAYEVSDQGRVRSVERRVYAGNGTTRINNARLMRQQIDKLGRPTLGLWLDGRQATKMAHSLVAEAFLGPRPDGMEVCHNNGQPQDNRVENLRYDTRSANQFDRLLHGTHHYGNRTHCGNGHEFTPGNTLLRTDTKGARRCRTCLNERSREYKRRKRATA